MRVRAIAASVLAAAAVGVLPHAADAAAKAPATPKPGRNTVVINEFRVEYEAHVTWKHQEALPGWNETGALSYAVKGTLPNVSFVSGALSTAVSRTVDTTVEGAASVERVQPEGTSATCSGKTVTVRGIVGIGRARHGIWLGPWLSGTGHGTCNDSDGGTNPLELKVSWPAPTGKTDDLVVPSGAQEYVLSHRMDVDRWSEPFRVAVADVERCPNFNPVQTVGCSYEMKGTLTLTRVSRKEEEEDPLIDELLGPNEPLKVNPQKPPKLNRKKTKATTEVECAKACDIEALIGVFGGTKKRPKVTPIRSKKMRLKAKTAKTISLPLNAKARAVAKQGRLVMTLKAKGGKRRIYPLT